MSRRRCCCGCWYREDNFNRADSTDLGSNWDEIDGDWEIWNNRLLETMLGSVGVNDRIVIYNTDVPALKMVVWVDLANGDDADDTAMPVDGSKWRVIVGWHPVSQGYYYVDFEWTTGTGLTVGLYTSADPGSPLQEDVMVEDQLPLDWPHRVMVCLTPQALAVAIEAAEESAGGYPDIGFWRIWEVDPGPINSPARVGLGNPGPVAITFDNFHVAVHDNAVDDDGKDAVNCPQCVCWCNGNVIPMDLTGTFHSNDVGELCACMDGEEVHIPWDPSKERWDGTVTFADCVGSPVWGVYMSCTLPVRATDEEPCLEYSVSFIPDDPDAIACCNTDHAEVVEGSCAITVASCTCNPFTWIGELIPRETEIGPPADPVCSPCENPCDVSSDPNACEPGYEEGGYWFTIAETAV